MSRTKRRLNKPGENRSEIEDASEAVLEAAASPPFVSEQDEAVTAPAESLSLDAPTDELAQSAAPTTSAATDVGITLERGILGDIQSSSRSQTSAGIRGKKAPARPKFSGRRSQASRQALLKEVEEKKQREEQAAKTREQDERAKLENRSRGSTRGRGRGGYMGDFGRKKQDNVSSGPFSAGEAHRVSKEQQRQSGWGGRGGQKGLQIRGDGAASEDVAPDASSRLRASGKNTVDGRRVKQDPDDNDFMLGVSAGRVGRDGEVIDVSSDESGAEDKNGRKPINVDDLVTIDLTKDGIVDPFMPVRIRRVPHKKRTFGTITSTTIKKEGDITSDTKDGVAEVLSEKRKGKQKVRDLDLSRDRTSEQVMDTENVETLESPTTEETHAASLLQEPPSSPEIRRKVKEKIKRAVSSREYTTDKPDHQTQEEVEEWERHQADLDVLRSELGNPLLQDDNTFTQDDDADASDPRKNKVYVFQFPPVLPDLSPVAIKPDPANEEDMHVDSIDRQAPPHNTSEEIKSVNLLDNGGLPSRPSLPSGAVGKLRVHASGRVTLDWGGTSLVVGMGSNTNFLQDLIVAKLPDADQKKGTEGATEGNAGQSSDNEEKEEKGTAFSMGQVKGKFVVTPDWDSILG